MALTNAAFDAENLGLALASLSDGSITDVTPQSIDKLESPPAANRKSEEAACSEKVSDERLDTKQHPASRAGGRSETGADSRQRPKNKKTLGSMLRARRLELRMTQREVAAKLGVKPAHVAYLELDDRRPSLSLLGRIAELLDLDRERLILLSHPEARSFLGTRSPEAIRNKDQAWREFKKNKGMQARYKIKKQELRILSQVALLGRITAPRSFLFILNSIRQAVEEEDV
jgi:transcriptional regulator with XRE-family HTH domain